MLWKKSAEARNSHRSRHTQSLLTARSTVPSSANEAGGRRDAALPTNVRCRVVPPQAVAGQEQTVEAAHWIVDLLLVKAVLANSL